MALLLLLAAPLYEFIDVIPIQTARKIRHPSYQAKIDSMNKVELLEEMARFQEERSARGWLNLDMMIRGQILFRALEASAETEELGLFSGAYRRHLKYKLNELLKQQKTADSIKW